MEPNQKKWEINKGVIRKNMKWMINKGVIRKNMKWMIVFGNSNNCV
jgi:hypothetical protein